MALETGGMLTVTGALSTGGDGISRRRETSCVAGALGAAGRLGRLSATLGFGAWFACLRFGVECGRP